MARTATKKKEAPKRRRTLSVPTSQESVAQGEFITPYAYAKLKGLERPQPVYQWVTKQGAPHKVMGGKIYINVEEIDTWLGTRDEKRTERKASTSAKTIRREGPGEEVMQLLLTASATIPRTEAWCTNCRAVTEWIFDIDWTDLDLSGPYQNCKCVGCNWNLRMYPVSQKLAIAAMKGEAHLQVPKYSSHLRMEPEEWVGTEPDSEDLVEVSLNMLEEEEDDDDYYEDEDDEE